MSDPGSFRSFSGGFGRRCWFWVVVGFGLAFGPSPAFRASGASREPWVQGRVVGSPLPPAPYTVRQLFPGRRFENPVDLALLPGTDRWVVAEQSGRFWSWDRRDAAGAGRGESFLDYWALRPGLDNVLGFAFHPGFATNRWVFVNGNEAGGRPEGSWVARFRVEVPAHGAPRVEPGSERIVITWPSGGHNGCTLAFGTDGRLFISTGDGANPDPPDGVFRTGQDLGDLLAAVLRIDVDRPEPGKGYSVPSDNPFVGLAGARPEVWAFGFRNPFRMSVDPATGDLWVGDVGWEQWEMVYRVRRGGNYGWPITEGPNLQVRTDVKPGPGPILPALAALPHSEAASLTGGRVYHGERHPGLRGAYVYGDWETGRFWGLRHDGDRLTSNQELCDTTLKPVALADDERGELLILDYNGGVYELAPNAAPPANLAFPRRLSETGLFADVAARVPAPGVVPYQPRAGFWSDHARVERWLAVPGDGAVASAGGRETITGRMWFFPSNTVFARTLDLEFERGNAGSRRPVETQLMHFDGQGWNAYTFRWNPAGTDADLVPPEGVSERLSVADPAAPGGRMEIPWRFLGRSECLRCHNVWAGDVLSFNWLQLGAPTGSTEAARLAALGVFQPRRAPDRVEALADPGDAGAPLEARARSWLHVQCAGCHRFGAGGGVNLHLNFELRPAEWRALGEPPARGDLGLDGARIVSPGDPWRSVLYLRVMTEGTARMPHIGSSLADPLGTRLVADWIRTLPRPDGTGGDDLAARLDRLPVRPAEADLEPFLGSVRGALALLERASAEPGPLRSAAAAAAARSPDLRVRDLFQRLLPPSERRAVLGADPDPARILGLSGDPVRGRDLFSGAAQCARCHVRDGVGRAFGPDLGAVGGKYRRAELLDHVLHPSRVIAPEFRSTLVVLDDESESTGFVVRRTADVLVIRDEREGERTIPASKVREVRSLELSAMPEGLLAALTAQEAADLLDYLLLGSGGASSIPAPAAWGSPPAR